MGVLKWIVRAAVFAFVFAVWALYLQPFVMPLLVLQFKDPVLAYVAGYLGLLLIAWILASLVGWWL